MINVPPDDAMEILTRDSAPLRSFFLPRTSNHLQRPNITTVSHARSNEECGMIRCVVPRGSSAAKWLTTFNHTHKTSKSSSTEQEDVSSTTAASATVQVASTDGVEGGKGSNTDVGRLKGTNDGSKPRSQPYKPRDLPLSPFMDPEAVAARGKHKSPKAPPSKTPTLFQQQLAKNPYAQALATPVRVCQVTDASLPNYFLQDFALMAHPETREPWWVPTSLRKKHEDTETMVGKEEARSVTLDQDSELPFRPKESDGVRNVFNPNRPLPVETEPPSSPPGHRKPPPPSLGPGVYTLSRQALLTAMKNTHSGWAMPPWKNFATGSTKSSAIARKVRDHAFWRTDMETFVLELMRRRIVEGLVYLARRKRGFVASRVDWEDAKMAGRQQGVILWTGKLVCEEGNKEVSAEADGNGKATALDEERSGEQTSQSNAPPGFATLTVGKDKPHLVPVHNLPMLLGPDYLTQLRMKCPIFEKEILTVRDKRTTVDIQMKLWKLQGYLSFPEIRDGKSLTKFGRHGSVRIIPDE